MRTNYSAILSCMLATTAIMPLLPALRNIYPFELVAPFVEVTNIDPPRAKEELHTPSQQWNEKQSVNHGISIDSVSPSFVLTRLAQMFWR